MVNMGKEEKYKDYLGDTPLENIKHEAFAINLLTMTQGEAYIQAGYNQTGDNATKSASRLLSTNGEVLKRYEYLKEQHNKSLEKRGIISREQMIANAIYAMNCSLGRLPVKKIAKHKNTFYTDSYDDLDEEDKKRIPKSADKKNIEISHEYYTQEELEEHDIKAFPTIWDKLMNALDYYPKEKENLRKTTFSEMSDKYDS